MLKFSQINESKTFLPDPTVIKKYASYIIPLYIQGELNCKSELIDEYLEMNKSKNKDENKNLVSDLEVLAIKNLFDSPLTANGYTELVSEIKKKCPKLESFLRKFYQKNFDLD
jgi:hypothetical protein